MKSLVFKSVRCACVCGALLFGLATPPAFAASQEHFATPEEAVKALTAAVEPKDTNALDAIFGPELHDLVSADAVQASNRFAIFARRISEKVALTRPSDD